MGEDIPREARIVAIADVFDALITKRSYKEAFPIEKVLDIMKQSRGNHFDPYYIDVFFENIEKIMFVLENNKE